MSSFSRRDFLRSTMAVAAVGAVGSQLGTVPALGASAASTPFLPYSSDSYFKSRIKGAPVNDTLTQQFRAFMKSHPDQVGKPYPYINGITDAWGSPYAEGSATDPIWKLTSTGYPGIPVEQAFLKTQGVHAPEWLGKMLTGTSDSPLLVIDRAAGLSVWAWKAALVGPHTINVAYASAFWHNSNGLDRRNPRSNNTRYFMSRGFIPDATVIRRDLMDAAIANQTGLGHVLHMFLVETKTTSGFCHPMVGTESGKYGWGAEGTRIAIDPRIDLRTRGLSPAGLVVARTLKRHGCYLGDNSGSSSALKAEQATAGRNPWAGLNFNQRSLAGITWDDFVVLQ